MKHLNPCFLTTLGKIQDNFGEIWRIQMQMYPQTAIEPKYGEFYLKNKVSAHGLVLLVQLSWRVAPPYKMKVSGVTSCTSVLAGNTGRIRQTQNIRLRATTVHWRLWALFHHHTLSLTVWKWHRWHRDITDCQSLSASIRHCQLLSPTVSDCQ